MYVDYRIINEKEVVAINEEVESVKITGPNTGDIKKLCYYTIKLME